MKRGRYTEEQIIGVLEQHRVSPATPQHLPAPA